MIVNITLALSVLAAFASLAARIAFGRGDPWPPILLAAAVMGVGTLCALACVGMGVKAPQPKPRYPKRTMPQEPPGPPASRIGPHSPADQ